MFVLVGEVRVVGNTGLDFNIGQETAQRIIISCIV